LIRHYQRNSLSIRTFEAEGDRQYIKLAAQGRSWQLLQETYRPSHNKIVRADWALPLVMGRDEVDRLLTGHWCQAGDFVVRSCGEGGANHEDFAASCLQRRIPRAHPPPPIPQTPKP
jgi:hypothetical protein